MKKKIIITSLSIVMVVLLVFGFSINSNKEVTQNTKKLTGMVVKCSEESITVQDNNSIIYTFNNEGNCPNIGNTVEIEYTGTLNKNKTNQTSQVISYSAVAEEVEDVPSILQDNGIFSDFYTLAYSKLQGLSLEEKIGQVLLVRYPDSNQVNILQKYNLSGFVFYEKDFTDKTKSEVKQMISTLQKSASIPLLTAVDEEGGNVVRIGSNSNLVPNGFKSPSELYEEGGLDAIEEDTIEKSEILNSLGLNVNLAPVVDVADDGSYIYERTLKQDTATTSKYAKTVIDASKNTGVSYVLKHFPGYGNNTDTHSASSTDTRTYSEIVENDLPPFESGINAGAEAVLVSHNIVTAIDDDNPASLSTDVHNLLRNSLAFTGVIITDDLSMSAVSDIENVAVVALEAGNDLLITTNYEESFNQIKDAIEDGTLSESSLDRAVFRVLAWKYYKLLITSAK